MRVFKSYVVRLLLCANENVVVRVVDESKTQCLDKHIYMFPQTEML
jgi:hypothetical protein